MHSYQQTYRHRPTYIHTVWPRRKSRTQTHTETYKQSYVYMFRGIQAMMINMQMYIRRHTRINTYIQVYVKPSNTHKTYTDAQLFVHSFLHRFIYFSVYMFANQFPLLFLHIYLPSLINRSGPRAPRPPLPPSPPPFRYEINFLFCRPIKTLQPRPAPVQGYCKPQELHCEMYVARYLTWYDMLLMLKERRSWSEWGSFCMLRVYESSVQEVDCICNGVIVLLQENVGATGALAV